MTTDTLSSHSAQQRETTPARPGSGAQTDRVALAGRRILQANALTGIVSGPALLFGAGLIARVLGLEQYAAAVPVAQVIGAGLILFAALLLWIARRPVPAPVMLTIGIADALWVIASAALLLASILPLSTAGFWLVLVQADVIALFAALELRSWWRTKK